MRYKWLIGGIWLTIIVGIVFAIRHTDGPPAPTTIIATLLKTTTGTLFRPSDYLLWTEANHGQPLGDGDFVATANKGGATLKFEDGRALQLGPDTILIVTKSSGEAGDLLTINLVQGRVAAPKLANKKTYATPLRIDAGDRTITLAPTAQTFSVVRNSNTLTIKAANGEASLKEKSQPVAQVLTNNVTIIKVQEDTGKSLSDLLPRISLGAKPAPVLAAPPTTTVKPQTKPVAAKLTAPGQAKNVRIATALPKLSPEPEAPPTVRAARLRLMPRQKSFWTLADFDTALPKLRSVWMATVSNSDVLKQPTAQLTCSGRAVSGRVPVKARRFSLTATGESVALATTKTTAQGAMVERRYDCAATIAGSNGLMAAESGISQLVLRAFSAAGTAPVSVYLGALRRDKKGMHTLWHTDDGAISQSAARAVLTLNDPSLLQRLTPWLNGASGFAVNQAAPIAGEAYHYVRDGKIIASITMNDVRPENLRLLASDLEADLLFYGRESDIMPQLSPAGRRIWLEDRASKGLPIYILDRGLFVELDPQFLLQEQAAQSYVEGRSLAWFTQPVQVLK